MPNRTKKRTALEPLKIKLYQALKNKDDLTTVEQQQLKWLEKDPDLGGWKNPHYEGIV